MDDFQYIVERKTAAPVCFGSKLPRSVDPTNRKMMNSFQKATSPDYYKNLSPTGYHLENLTSFAYRITNKIRSNKGVPSLVDGEKRFSDKIWFQVPPSTKYHLPSAFKKLKEGKVPFDSKIIRKFPLFSTTPGPGTYSPGKLCKRTRVAFNLGKPKMIPAVEIFCAPYPNDKCAKCGKPCDYDFWHQNYTVYLCHFCMREEVIYHRKFSKEQLEKFIKIRNCSYRHSHERTTAAIRLVTEKQVAKMEKLENYLSVFLKSC